MSRSIQFSLRFLLVAMAVVAAAVAAIASEPSWQSSLALSGLSLLFFTAGIVAVRQTDGRLQTFWIGTALVLGFAPFFTVSFTAWAALMWLSPYAADGPGVMEDYGWGEPALRAALPTLWCAAPINGLFAVFLHWLFPGRRKDAA